MFGPKCKKIAYLIILIGCLLLTVTCFISNAAANPRLKAAAKFPVLPNWACSPNQAEWDEYYQSALQLLMQNSMFPNKIDSKYWEHKFDGTLHSAQAAQSAVMQLIASLNDDYTYFRNIEDTQQRINDLTEKNIVESKKISFQSHELGYVHIKTFASNFVAGETEAALKDMTNVEGYILDLRDNNGGRVDEAYKVFALLCNKGKFVTIKGRLHGDKYIEELYLTNGKCKKKVNGIIAESADFKSYTGKKPIIVLTNNKTRSAAEMLAGALRDNHRGIIIGTKTFGKGVVQNTWILENGTSIKIAIAYYYLPNGESIHGTGLTPDKFVFQLDGHADSQLSAAKQELDKLLGSYTTACNHLKIKK